MKHIDIGTIHAFLDGELSGDALEYAASHFSICDACSNLMLEAESETDNVMQAFAIENAYTVPTQRIWARINNEIDLLESIPEPTPQTSVWQRLSGLFGFDKSSPFGVPAAGFALGVALVAVFTFYNLQTDNSQINPELAENRTPVTTVILNSPPVVSGSDVTKDEPSVFITTDAPKRLGGIRAVKANYRVVEKPRVVTPKTNTIRTPQPKEDLNSPLVEERLYLDAINDLSQTVASTDKDVMKPSFRVEYEQNIAMVDKAIERMQRQVRRNPNDENAKRILFASYQNKIDLLNTVAEKSQLMATIR
ncbi:MAG: hypothetical protein M3209_18355 [Acidobacteriota bacterium]|nr:hypothetical protein [Acidobacteriota bacterium]